MTTLHTRAAEMLERYGRVDGVMHCEVSMLIAELRAAAALDELVRENERLGLYDDQKPVAFSEPIAWMYQNANTDKMYLVWDKSDGGRNWMPLYAAPAPAQPAACMAPGSEMFSIVYEQANDDGLWFRAQTTPEAYLQQELRRLHAAIEAGPPAQPRQPLSADDVRSQFEAWVLTKPGHPFAGQFLNLMWDAWKAARAITGGKP